MQRRRFAEDDIWRVHARYLGPAGKTLPFSILLLAGCLSDPPITY